MGHSSCGGVRACLERDGARQTETRFISNWMSMLDEARERVLQAFRDRSLSEVLAELEREGVRTSIDNLRTFPCIKGLESKGRVALHGAYFDIASGTLSVLNQATAEYVNL
jgi:carbonic anhydrase